MRRRPFSAEERRALVGPPRPRIEGDWVDAASEADVTTLTVEAGVSEGGPVAVHATNRHQPWSPASGTLGGSVLHLFGISGILDLDAGVITWTNGRTWRKRANTM